jgi:hypothetical protein
MVRTDGGQAGKGTLCEVSASGARLRFSLPLAIHAAVRVRISVNPLGAPGHGTWVEAEVVRQTADGFGLAWTEFAPEAARSLFAPTASLDNDTAPLQPKVRRLRPP